MNKLDDTTMVPAKKLLDSLVGMHNVLNARTPETTYEEGRRGGWITAVNYLRRLVCIFSGVERVDPMTGEEMAEVPEPNVQQVPTEYEGIGTVRRFVKPDLTLAEARMLVDAFYERHPELQKLHEYAEQLAKESNDRGTSIYGRRRHSCTCDPMGKCAGADEGETPRDRAIPVAGHAGTTGGSGLQAGCGCVDREAPPAADEGGDRSVQGEAAEAPRGTFRPLLGQREQQRFLSGFGDATRRGAPDDEDAR